MKFSFKSVITISVFCLISAFSIINNVDTASAHSGGTDSSGCHTCHTNCPSYGLAYEEYHCHTPKGNSSYSNPTWNPPLSPSYCILEDTTTLSREDMALIQSILKRKGYRPGTVDGYYGSQTRAALNRYELKWKLPKSKGSTLRNRTLEKLNVFC
jgi:hypothetical protein